MRKLTFVLSLLFCLICTAGAKEKVIERPPFTAWSSTSIEFAKVTLTDTATVVDIDAAYTPKQWIKIAATSFLRDEKGNTYPIRSGVGIALDKEFWMPESGKGEFKLIFPPLPDTVTTIDFSEGDFDGAFKIWGIDLSNKKTPFALPKGVVLPKKERGALKDPTFTYGKAVLSGKVLDYQKGMVAQNLVYVFSPINTGGNIDFKINDDGTFRIEIDAVTHTAAMLYVYPLCMTEVYLAPGKETSVIVNTRECTRRKSRLQKDDAPHGEQLYFGGYLAGLQQELQNKEIDMQLFDNFETFADQMKGKSIEEVAKVLVDKSQELTEQIKKTSLSPAAKEMLTTTAQVGAAENLLAIDQLMKSIHITSNKLPRQEASDYYTKTTIDVPESIYAPLLKFPALMTPKALYANGGIRGLIRQTEQLKKVFKSDKGVVFDAATVQGICESIANFVPLTAEQEATIATFAPAYGELIRSQNAELLKKLEANKKKSGFTINQAGEVSNEDLFASIISKFSGKVILVDFWATWCGPCRMANKAMIPMKEELKDQEIVYLYIAGENSPKGEWENMVTDIHGEHFRVTDDQWKFLSSSFKIEGVPTYLVIDREGNVTFKQVGFPGVNKMKEELTKATSK